MNAPTIEILLLLEQSGELTPDQRHQLDAELAASPEAQKRRAELRGLADAIPSIATEPAPDAADRIAGRLAQTPAAARAFRPIWKPALAAAAVLAILFSLRSFSPSTPMSAEPEWAQATMEEEWADPFEEDFTELESLLAAIDTDDSMEDTEL